MNPIPFNRAYATGREGEYLARVTDGSSMAGDGYFTRKCRHWFRDRFGVADAFITGSCTTALEMSAMLCNIGPGDEVIMPSFTFVSTASAFAQRGAIPVFVDIRRDTLNIDERLIEPAITSRTKAIVPVHYAGTPCAMGTIMQIADRHGLYVIEDAAHSIMSSCDGALLGSIGHVGCFSFHETKNLSSGHGGALLVNDTDLTARAEIIWEKGTNRSQFLRGEVDKYTWVDLGSSFAPGELTSAYLFAQLEHADEITALRCGLYHRYRNCLRPLAERGLFQLPDDNGLAGNGHLISLLARNSSERDALLAHLNAKGINALFHYVPLHSSPAGLRYGRVSGDMHVTEMVATCLVRLPMFAGLQESEIDYICQQVSAFYQHDVSPA